MPVGPSHRHRSADINLDMVKRVLQTSIWMMRGLALLLGFLVCWVAAISGQPAHGQTAANASPVPLFWRVEKDATPPDLRDLGQIKIVTSENYPPFNYRDASGKLAGFNIEIMQAICASLRIQCSLSTAAYDSLLPALEDGRADVVAASLARSRENFRRADFSKPYFKSGGRFAVRLQNPVKLPTPREFAGRRLGVVAETSHEAFLKANFSRSNIRSFDSLRQAADALRLGNIDALFGDNLALAFWVQGELSKRCCRLTDGSFWESNFFGDGAGLAARRGDCGAGIQRDAGEDRRRGLGFPAALGFRGRLHDHLQKVVALRQHACVGRAQRHVE